MVITAALFSGLLCGFACGCVCWHLGVRDAQDQAVAAGVAEYWCDPVSGKTWLVYKEAK